MGMKKKEYAYRLNVLLDEKDAAKVIMDKIKNKPDKVEHFKMINIYRNRVMRNIRELKAEYTS